ncbi:multifunctional procollagen lysine hydroxylase and glycosyltransferase LH3-like [Haliotis rubra]|uniref:multifunctional procollagen lysine hydroxylase and glycosyltransferase LH3-like n=1 Tax=Haliotis rubra TaxID=36100 RepID=UPI001EE5EF04|nr:multifunctional procollagen lysine hydroxylase and glycosyltransferase LH3-like [Haliotis rubra]
MSSATLLSFVFVLSTIILQDILAAEDDLMVVTVATDETDGFKRFLRSVKKYGFELKVLGMGEEWDGGDVANYAGGGHKINLLAEGLKKYQDRDDLLLMFVDSYDVIFNNDPDTIIERFKKFDARVVFSAEGFCWPDRSLQDQYPSVTINEKRFLNSGGFMGYAKDVYEMITHESVSNRDDDQLYYTKIFLDENLRDKWRIKLDTRSEIFQNLNGALGEVVIKSLGSRSYLYNLKSGTSPTVVHGNGPIKAEFNRIANYLADGWTIQHGCQSCEEDTISLEGLKEEDYPTVLVALFIERSTPFLEEFLEAVASQNYPKSRMDLYIHNLEDTHRKTVEAFIDEYQDEYQSVTSIGPYDGVGEAMGRNWAIAECIKKNCNYLWVIDSDARYEEPEALKLLIQQNRSVIAPLVSRVGKLWSNFWGALGPKGFYARSEDYADIVETKKVGLWNVPFISSTYLVQGQKLPSLRNAYSINSELDPDMSFTKHVRDQGSFLYVTNRQKFGHLVEVDHYETDHYVNDMFDIFNNPTEWEERYIHPDYAKSLNEDADILQPCPDVFWFPVVTEQFCKDFVDTMENFGQWSGGKNEDPRLATGYENVPTVDIHMNQVGFERHWLHILRKYVRPLQEKVFQGYFHDPPHAIMNFVVRYRPDEQPLLRPHHDSSTYTVNLALNSPGVDFEGGGCRFIRYDCKVTATRKGWMLMHPGRLTHYHEGLRVTNGTRYIMISFVDP